VIWEWLFRQVVDLMTWIGAQVAGLVPPVPSWVTGLPGMISTVVGKLNEGGAWFPVELLAPVLVAVVLTYVAGLAIKLVRIVASFLTLGGGGAG